ncbi:MAG: hypothetical protein AAGG44_06830 [Planctomycetota bacterium]
MRNLKFVALVLCLVGSMGLTAQAGGGKGGGKNSVDVYNGNQYDEADGDIRVWLISPDEAPSTKAEADALPSVNLPGMVGQGFFNLDDGEYLLVAVDEEVYETLPPEFELGPPGGAYAALALELEGGEKLQFTVTDDPENTAPIISEGINPPGGPGGPGGDM